MPDNRIVVLSNADVPTVFAETKPSINQLLDALIDVEKEIQAIESIQSQLQWRCDELYQRLEQANEGKRRLLLMLEP